MMPGGIDHSDDMAGDTSHEPRVGATWVSFCAGANIVTNNRRSCLLSRGILAGLEGLLTSEVRGLYRRPFCSKIYSIKTVGGPSATGCCCCKGLEKN